MTSVTTEEAQTRLSHWIEQLSPGEQLVITRDDRPIARLLAEKKNERKPRIPGSANGLLKILVEDDEHLRDFEEYMG